MNTIYRSHFERITRNAIMSHGFCGYVMVLLVLAVMPWASVAQTTICPVGWYAYGQRCFHGECSRLNWNQAQNNCAAHGGFLATSDSASANTIILLMVQLAAGQSGELTRWIGLNRIGARCVYGPNQSTDRPALHYRCFGLSMILMNTI